MEITYSLCLPRDEVSVPIVRHLSREALIHLGVVESCVGDIELALTEACTNVLKHARSEQEQYEVEVEVNFEFCVIRVIDTGGGFDSDAARSVEQIPAAEGGRGIFLMSALVDRLHFESKPEKGTVVHLEKRLALDDDSVLLRMRERQADSDAAAL